MSIKDKQMERYRLGRKQRRAILNEKGHEVALFHKGYEYVAKKTVELLNYNEYINKAHDFVPDDITPSYCAKCYQHKTDH